ncbi:MAG: OsmC family protein [Bacteroidota bacterium]
MKSHHYHTQLRWTGNLGQGTKNYRVYSRNHELLVEGKSAPILGASDPSFRGDPSRYNPEELLVASLSACHMLWYLHLCSVNGITVTAYEDTAKGQMQENEDGSGQFTEVTLYPTVRIQEADQLALAEELHSQAHQKCFIARSVNFPVRHEVSVVADR